MIELNTKTVKNVVTILVRKSDWSVSLFTGEEDELGRLLNETRFNLNALGEDDRLLVGSQEGVLAIIQLLSLIVSQNFYLARDNGYLLFVREDHLSRGGTEKRGPEPATIALLGLGGLS